MDGIISLEKFLKELSDKFSKQINDLKFDNIEQVNDLLAGFQSGAKMAIFELVNRGVLKMTGTSISAGLVEPDDDPVIIIEN